MSDVKSVIESGKAVLGIEFGSTRIKAVLIGDDHAPIATGAHDWENMLVDGIWTYSLDMIWEGISDCYSKMAQDAKEKYGVTIKKLAAIGISGMMHGYLPFDKEDNLLVHFGHGEIPLQVRLQQSLLRCLVLIFRRGGA